MLTTALAITGASGSGKTSLATTLSEDLRIDFPGLDIRVLGEDSYYRDLGHLTLAQRERVNFDHPSALEHNLLLKQLRALKAGEAVEVPNYNYSTHTRHTYTSRLESTEILIVEGILLLSHAELRVEFDLRLFIDAPLDLCLSRRKQRDCVERGRSIESIERQFEAAVIPMFNKYVAPSRNHAHLVLSGHSPPKVLSRQVRAEMKDRGFLDT